MFHIKYEARLTREPNTRYIVFGSIIVLLFCNWTFIVENYLDCGLPSVRQLILRRYVQFVQTLISSANPVIWQLANLAVTTVRSTTGLNIKRMFDEFGMDPLITNKRQFVISRENVPADKEENLELLNYLLHIRSSEHDEEIISELNDLIFDICTQ